MPQMSPLSWLTLMIQFILLFSLFNVMIYFLFEKNKLILKLLKNKKTINWQW
uniref:ATP synthase F0 subunit 8 n=1 Tax=Chrysolagria sp. CHR01 TaxID=1205615 RepID=A0A0S2MP67_9CUCU|nr:ATP synthase F0 subunit 8 [Chrysolagria sp. CHR01]